MAGKKNNTKQEKSAPTAEFVCEVISKSIREIVDMSKDEDFKQKCCDLVQANTDSENLEINLKEYFLKFTVKHPKKRSFFDAFFDSTPSKRECVSLESLIKDMFLESIDEDVNAIEELDGFDIWRKLTSENTE